MRTVITFNTLKYMEELQEAGMNQEEAKAITNATAKAFSQMMATHELVTKKDLKELKTALKADIKELELSIKADIKESIINTIKWIIGISFSQSALLLGIMSYIFKK